MIALAAIIVGLGTCLALGRELHEIGAWRLRWSWPVLGAFALQGAFRSAWPSGWGSPEVATLAWAALGAAVCALLLPDLRRAGVPLVMAGFLANILVVLVNNGMPVVHDGASHSLAGTAPFYHVAGAQDALLLLADLLPVPGGFLLSIGDVLLLVGIVVAMVGASSDNLDECCAVSATVT